MVLYLSGTVLKDGIGMIAKPFALLFPNDSIKHYSIAWNVFAFSWKAGSGSVFSATRPPF